MDFIIALISFVATAVVLGFALTFGLAIFGVLLLVGLISVAVILIRYNILRRRYASVHPPAESSSTVIEADYYDITDTTP
jgi:hypothetical protein